VSIHSRSCANLGRLSRNAPERVLAIAWGKAEAGEFPVDIEIQAFDRHGLVRDVNAALADEKISITGLHTQTDRREGLAHLRVGVAITGLAQLSRVLGRIGGLPGVVGARRRK
jgi:GTP pyrophosphokinase